MAEESPRESYAIPVILLVILNIKIKPTEGTLILLSRCSFSFPLLTVAMTMHS